MNNLQFDDVKVEEFTINGDESKKICFAPTDSNIITRYEACSQYFNSLSEEYTKIQATDDVFEQIRKYGEIDKAIKEKIDFIFNGKISEVLFGEKSCVSIASNGEPIFKNVVEALVKVVSDRISLKSETDSQKEIQNVRESAKGKEYLNKYKNHKRFVKNHDFKKSN